MTFPRSKSLVRIRTDLGTQVHWIPKSVVSAKCCWLPVMSEWALCVRMRARFPLPSFLLWLRVSSECCVDGFWASSETAFCVVLKVVIITFILGLAWEGTCQHFCKVCCPLCFFEVSLIKSFKQILSFFWVKANLSVVVFHFVWPKSGCTWDKAWRWRDPTHCPYSKKTLETPFEHRHVIIWPSIDHLQLLSLTLLPVTVN